MFRFMRSELIHYLTEVVPISALLSIIDVEMAKGARKEKGEELLGHLEFKNTRCPYYRPSPQYIVKLVPVRCSDCGELWGRIR